MLERIQRSRLPLGLRVLGLRVMSVTGAMTAAMTAAAMAAGAAAPQLPTTPGSPAAEAKLRQAYGELPLSFEADQGQADKNAKFLARGNGYGLYLTGQEAVLVLRRPVPRLSRTGSPHRLNAFGIARNASSAALPAGHEAGNPAEAADAVQKHFTTDFTTDIVRMQLAGASATAVPAGQDRLPGTSNYFLGSDPSHWHTAIPTYGKVRYAGVYPGIDLVYYGNQQQLEYDFVVAPGANPDAIRLRFTGASGATSRPDKILSLDTRGNLSIEPGNRADGANDSNGANHSNDSVGFQKPTVYQEVDGTRRTVAGEFKLLADNTVGFTLGRYDHSRPLIIDPVLGYSTYLGGSTAEFVVAVAADASGNAYVTGLTASTDFPLTAGAFQAVNYASSANAVSTAFVSKFNASGTALVYSTFLGGNAIPDTVHNQGDYGHGIAVDASGNAYVAGYTYSSNFPITANAFQKTNVAVQNRLATGFVTKINATGTGLIYSTFLGGSELSEPGSIAIDSSGNAYISGQTFATDFPVSSTAYQTTNHSAGIHGANLFVTKLNPTGSGIVYSTYLGGSNDNGQIFSQLILTNPIAVDKSGDAYVASFTESGNFPVTTGAYLTADHAVNYIATVSKLNPAGTALLYSTFLGGDTSYTFPQGLAVDGSGNAYVGGFTACTDFPVTSGALQTTNKAFTGSNYTDAANDNGFVTKINPTGSGLVYSTYLGGTTGPWGGDAVYGLAVDSAGDAYVSGGAMSDDFPVTSNAYQSKNKGATHCCDYLTYTSNAFLSELNPAGSSLIYSTYLGGSGTQNPEGPGGYGDEAYALALGRAGNVYIAGYTSSSNFPVSTGAFDTKYGSEQNMAFVALFELGAPPATKVTSTTLTASANPVLPGTAITFTATVAPASGTVVPTGNVVFSIDETTVATVALSGGKATYATSTLAAGAHYVLASYGGSTTYLASGDGFNEFVTPATPVITPIAGTYTSQQTVNITDTTAGAVIYDTLDGTKPTVFSTLYAGPITVNIAKTVSAVAVAQHDASSSVATAAYKIIGSPSVLAAPASAISTPSATLNGFVNTLGLAGSCAFKYGTSSTALTTTTAATALAASTTRMQVSAKLTTLASKTTYYYQVIATTAGGITAGQVLSFTTN